MLVHYVMPGTTWSGLSTLLGDNMLQQGGGMTPMCSQWVFCTSMPEHNIRMLDDLRCTRYNTQNFAQDLLG